LIEGANYATLSSEERLEFIASVVRLLSQVPSFRISTRLGRRQNFEDWPGVLRWWLAKFTLRRQPRASDITKWYDFVAQNFIYRAAWGLGSVLALLLDLGADEQPIRALEIDDWPRSGLPWIAFWLKELITWGTLDPVAAFLLARGDAIDRPQAELDAAGYYAQLQDDIEPNDILDPRRIREWVDGRIVRGERVPAAPALNVPVTLAREAAAYLNPEIHVMQYETGDFLNWIDPAGYLVGTSPRPRNWPVDSGGYHFQLDVPRAVVRGVPYLPHA
jgi:hypothetical protein